MPPVGTARLQQTTQHGTLAAASCCSTIDNMCVKDLLVVVRFTCATSLWVGSRAAWKECLEICWCMHDHSRQQARPKVLPASTALQSPSPPHAARSKRKRLSYVKAACAWLCLLASAGGCVCLGEYHQSAPSRWTRWRRRGCTCQEGCTRCWDATGAAPCIPPNALGRRAHTEMAVLSTATVHTRCGESGPADGSWGTAAAGRYSAAPPMGHRSTGCVV
eukprot:358811-Chlamydomonas_euryale.AAC.25